MKSSNVLPHKFRWLQGLQRALFILIPLCVAVVSFTGIGSVERAKLFVFVGGVIVLLLVVLARVLLLRAWSVSFRWVHGLFLLAGALVLVSFGFSNDLFAALFGAGGVASTTALSLLAGLVFAWMIWTSSDHANDLSFLTVGWVAGMALVSVDVVLAAFGVPFVSHVFGVADQTVSLLGPTYEQAGVVFAASIPFAMTLIDRGAKWKTVQGSFSLLGIASAVLMFAALITVNATLGFVTLALVGFVTLILLLRGRVAAPGKTIALTALTVIGVVLWIAPLTDWVGLKQGLDLRLDDQTSWGITVGALSDHFWTGVGPENFRLAFSHYVPRTFYAAVGGQILFFAGGTQLTQNLTTLGFVASLALLAVQLAPIGAGVYAASKQGAQSTPRRALLLGTGIVLLLVQFYVSFTVALAVFAWMVFGMLLAVYMPQQKRVNLNTAVVGAAAAIVLLVAAGVFASGARTIQAERAITQYEQAIRDEAGQDAAAQKTAMLSGIVPQSAMYLSTRSNVLLNELVSGRADAETATTEILEISGTLSQDFGNDPIVLVQVAEQLTLLRAVQPERAYDQDIAGLYAQAMQFNADDPFVRAQYAQNILARIQFDQEQGRIPQEEYSDTQLALAQAFDLARQAEQLLESPGSLQQLTDAISALAQEFVEEES